MLRVTEKDAERIDVAIGDAECHLFIAEGVIDEFIDEYFATPSDEKDDISMKELDMIEALRDRINDIYDINSEICAILEYFKNNEEE